MPYRALANRMFFSASRSLAESHLLTVRHTTFCHRTVHHPSYMTNALSCSTKTSYWSFRDSVIRAGALAQIATYGLWWRTANQGKWTMHYTPSLSAIRSFKQWYLFKVRHKTFCYRTVDQTTWAMCYRALSKALMTFARLAHLSSATSWQRDMRHFARKRFITLHDLYTILL